jgi:drug/metabolite transporter (DMT)-like permease
MGKVFRGRILNNACLHSGVQIQERIRLQNSVGANRLPLVFAVASAVLFGMGTPFAKLLLGDLPPVALAGLLYLGALVGLSLYDIFRRITSDQQEVSKSRLGRNDAPWLVGAIVAGGIVAPISLMTGLTMITGFSASLLLNLEGAATAIIATMLFKEHLGRRIVLVILCMTAAGVLLSWNPEEDVFAVTGPLLLIVAAVGWGLDNNFTRNICGKDPVQIAQIKGLVAGCTSIALALALGWNVRISSDIIWALVLGSLSYGASLVLFVLALQGLGASRTGAFFTLGPFVGAAVSVVLLNESLGWIMLPAAVLMVGGVVAMLYERHSHVHQHEEMTHVHLHSHGDFSHNHCHPDPVRGPHVHEHTHLAEDHYHPHWPDIHHRHAH